MSLWIKLGMRATSQAEHAQAVAAVRAKAAKCSKCHGTNTSTSMFACCGSANREIEFLEQEWGNSQYDQALQNRMWQG